MKYSKRVEIFIEVKGKYTGLLTSVLWKLTGDRELFTEALQYSLLGIWQNVEKLTGKKAGAYIYRIAMSANSKAWRNRIGRNGQISETQIAQSAGPDQNASSRELTGKVREAIAQLPGRQARAIVMRYIQQQSYKTVALKLGCSEAGARSHVSKALATLKTRLSAYAEGAI